MKFVLTKLALASVGVCLSAVALAKTDISFYFPVAVGGPITKTIDQYAADFNKDHPDLNVIPVYSGTYQETIVKVLTAHKAGKPPTAAILLSTDTFTLADEDAIVPIDNFVKTEADQAWMKSFFPAFMLNGQFANKTWGVPFQRSTVVLYWNKDLFKQAGLDPNTPPQTWADTISMGQKLTKRCQWQRSTVGDSGTFQRLSLLVVSGL